MEKQKMSFDPARHLLHPKLTVLVTCVDKNGESNIITIAWAMPVSIDPPLVAISVGKSRYSHNLVDESEEFAINIPGRDLLEEVKIIGSRSGSDIDKFSETGLTPEEGEKIESSLISECAANIECELFNQCEAGDHTIFIGRIVSSWIDKEFFDQEADTFDMSRFEPILHVGGSNFITSGEKLG